MQKTASLMLIIYLPAPVLIMLKPEIITRS